MYIKYMYIPFPLSCLSTVAAAARDALAVALARLHLREHRPNLIVELRLRPRALDLEDAVVGEPVQLHEK